MSTPKGEGEREAEPFGREQIIAGLKAFCECEPDFSMSPGMMARAAEFILGQPCLDERAAIVAWLTAYSNDMMHLDQNEGSLALMLAADAIRDGAHLNQKGQG